MYMVYLTSSLIFPNCFVIFNVVVSLNLFLSMLCFLILSWKEFCFNFIFLFYAVKYGKCNWFCILILYPETLINSNVSYSGFFEGSLSSSKLTIMSYVNKDILTSFLICMPFISLSFLIAMSKIYNKILIEVVRVDIPNLFVVLEESIQYFTIKNNVLVCHRCLLSEWRNSVYS